jgi:superfamily I DNA/RNA helicase
MAAIALTKEQQRLVEFVPQGNLLIRSEAGSGKTTVLAARAGRIKEINRDGRMLFITYNRSLVGYVTMLMARSGLAGEIDILTFHEWARKFVDELGGPVGMHIKEKKRKKKSANFWVSLLRSGLRTIFITSRWTFGWKRSIGSLDKLLKRLKSI